MPFKDAAYDPETILLMTRAFEAAWQEAEARGLSRAPADQVRTLMATAILSAVANGEFNPMRLRNFALRAVDSTGLH